jgi:hypothetical protein
MTAAMRRGHICEPIAGKAYATKLQNKVNLYPCGVVVNLWSPWIAASPDRKAYNPQRNPPFGLLEIKCPIVQHINEVKCLKKDADGQMKLKRNDNYFYQIMTQMAVTGLKYDKKQKIRQMTFILDISSIYFYSVVLTMTEPVVP